MGPWEGNLSNRGERLSLEKPALEASGGWVIVDEVLYSDVSPWPSGPDGSGLSLSRIHTDALHSGNDPSKWQAATPSPGSANP